MDNSISEIIQQQSQNQKEEYFLGPVLVKLQGRLESIEIKVMSLTKIVRLLQQYSEKKDLQYEKETQNMQIVDSKLAKTDYLQTQLAQALSRFQQLQVQCKTQNARLDHLGKSLQGTSAQIHTLQDRVNYDLSEVSKKISSIEDSMLQAIREGSQRTKQSQSHPLHSDQYAIEELTFRLSHLEAKVQADNQKIKSKPDKTGAKNRKNAHFDDDYYGCSGGKARKNQSRSKGSRKSLEFEGLKGLRSN